jgi:hypothetical protein
VLEDHLMQGSPMQNHVLRLSMGDCAGGEFFSGARRRTAAGENARSDTAWTGGRVFNFKR